MKRNYYFLIAAAMIVATLVVTALLYPHFAGSDSEALEFQGRN